MSWFSLYLITKLDALIGLSMFAAAFCFVIIIGCFTLGKDDNGAWKDDRYRRGAMRYGYAAIAFLLVALLLPSTNDALLMIGGHYVTNGQAMQDFLTVIEKVRGE